MCRVHGGNQVELGPHDFDALYRGEAAGGMDVGAVWDVRSVQPEVVRWNRAGLLVSPLFDAGCGAGANSIWAAKRGHRVTGVDFSAVALEQARGRAEKVRVYVEWVRGDVTALPVGGFEPQATILDSALFHCLAPEMRRPYLEGLAELARPGAHLLMLCFTEAAPRGMPGPFRIGDRELAELLPEAGWRLEELQEANYATRWTVEKMQHVAAVAGHELDESALRVEANGTVSLPVWSVVARRA